MPWSNLHLGMQNSIVYPNGKFSPGFIMWEESTGSLPSEILVSDNDGVFITGVRMSMDLIQTFLTSLDTVAHRLDTYIVPLAGFYCRRSALIDALVLGCPIAPEGGYNQTDLKMERGLHFDRINRDGSLFLSKSIFENHTRLVVYTILQALFVSKSVRISQILSITLSCRSFSSS